MAYNKIRATITSMTLADLEPPDHELILIELIKTHAANMRIYTGISSDKFERVLELLSSQGMLTIAELKFNLRGIDPDDVKDMIVAMNYYSLVNLFWVPKCDGTIDTTWILDPGDCCEVHINL